MLSGSDQKAGFKSFVSLVVPQNYEAVRLRGGGAEYPANCFEENNSTNYYYEHVGLSVWKETITTMPKVAKQALEEAGWAKSDLRLVLSHQANPNMLNFVFKRLGLDRRQTFVNADRIGNTADASLAIALDEANSSGLIREKVISYCC